MDASFATQESTTNIKMISPRRRPLQTCAVTILVISNRAFTIAQGLNGPLKFIINFAARLATLILAGPFAYALQHEWLTVAILSFIDNRILALEDVIERIYPPSHVVFNKIDDLVRVTESLPGKFDNFVSRYHVPGHVSQFSFLDWTLVRVISLLNFVAATLTYWRMSKGTKEEKEIKVDTTSNNIINEPGSVRQVDPPKEPLTNNKDPRGGQRGKSDHIMSPPLEGAATYKDVLLQKGICKGGNTVKKEEKFTTKDQEVENSVGDDDDDSERNSKDKLLELFESAWLMTSPRRSAKGNYTPRSVSFTF